MSRSTANAASAGQAKTGDFERHREDTRRGQRRTASPHVRLDRTLCEACWECIAVCPQSVLGKLEMWRHRHAVVSAGERCTGCGRCIRVCPAGALTAADEGDRAG
jgi:NAD-dependent dihydropyrimidine dehydrogenase PreA subunit